MSGKNCLESDSLINAENKDEQMEEGDNLSEIEGIHS